MRLSSARLCATFVALVISQIALSAATQTAGDQALSLNDISKRALPLIVSLTGEDANGQAIASGSGFFIRPGLMVTDFRIIKDAVRIHARSPGEDAFDVVIAAVDERRTVAVLTIAPVVVKAGEGPATMLRITRAGERTSLNYVEEPKIGDDVYVFSNYPGGDGSLSPNRVDEVREMAGTWYLHLTAALSPDSAGGPVLNLQGHVIGMVVATPNDSAGPSFAIAAGEIGGCGLDGFRATTGAPASAPEVAAPGGVSGGLVSPRKREAGEVTGSGIGTSGEPIRKAGGVLQGSAIRRAQPLYPPLAKAARISGSVVVEVTVDETGDVMSARAISGHPLLKDCAVAAARGWKFTPTSLSGTPVKVIGTVTFNFSLGSSELPTEREGPTGSGSGTPVPTSVDTRPIALNRVRPNYTEAARSNKVQGEVRCRVLVGADGFVQQVRIISGLPDGLNEEAIRTVHQLRFKPATLRGEPVAHWILMEVQFYLR